MEETQSLLNDFLEHNHLQSDEKCLRLEGGSRSVAYKINNQIIRIPTKEFFLEEQERESQISLFLQKYLPQKFSLKIPHLKFNGCYCVHQAIEGELLQSVWNRKNLSPTGLKNIAREIAELLYHIHNTPLNPIQDILAKYSKICRNENKTLNSDFDYRIARKHILNYSSGKIDLDNFRTVISSEGVALCHNDLHAENIIINNGDLAGFIDFGEAGINPRITDFFHFYRLSRDFALEVIKAYNDFSPFKINIKEADYQFLSNTGYTIEQRLRAGKNMPLFYEEVRKALLLFAESLK